MTNPENQSQGQWSDPTYPPAPPAWPAPPGADPAAAPPPPPTPTYPAYQAPPPYGAPPPPPPYGGAPGYGGYVAAAPQNGLAIAAMVCSLAGILTLISFPVGAILGHIALKQVRERGEQGEGFAKTGIIVGWIGTGLMVLCCGGYVVFFASLASTGAIVS